MQVHYLSTPNYEQAYGFLGMIYESQGQFDEAAATRQRAAGGSADEPSALISAIPDFVPCRRF